MKYKIIALAMVFMISLSCLPMTPTVAATAPEVKQSTDKVTLNDVLAIAKKYYGKTSGSIEKDLASELTRLITWKPTFDGKNQNKEFSKKVSVNVAILLNYYDCKNFNTALACAAFEKDIQSISSAINLGSAIIAYNDRNRGTNVPALQKEYLTEVSKVYTYAVNISKAADKLTKASVSPLVCFGDVLLDLGDLEKGMECYKSALSIDPNDKRALTGMERYYKLKKNNAMVMAMQKKQAEHLTELGKAANKIDKEREYLQEGYSLEGDALEAFAVKMSDSKAVILADFFKSIDKKTCDLMRKNVKAVADKMVIDVPSANVLTQFTHYSHTSDPAYLAAQEVFAQVLSEYSKKYYESDYKGKLDNQSDILEGMGIDMTLDGMDLGEFVNKVMENPGAYEGRDPAVSISGIGNAEQLAKDMMKAIGTGDDPALLKKVSQIDKAYKVLTLNPFEYANSYDILVQQSNIANLKAKTALYQKCINDRSGANLRTMTETTQYLIDKYYPLAAEMSIKEQEAGGDPIKLHAVHEAYYPKLNGIVAPVWGQATEVTAINYKKMEKLLPVMYKDCMQYIMLISDEEIRENEEKELKYYVSETVINGLHSVFYAYSLPNRFMLDCCDCDTDHIRKLKDELKKQKEAEANKKLAEQKKQYNFFKSGQLDKNSQFYKETIKKYEYEVNFGVFKYKTNEYESLHEVNIWTPKAQLDYKKLQNHFTGQSRTDANLEFGGDIDVGAAEANLSAKFGISFVRGKDGSVHPEDVDIRAGLKAGTSIKDVVELEGGVEASAQGLTGNSSVKLSGNRYVDKLKEKVAGEAAAKWIKGPDVSKPVWEGSYGDAPVGKGE